jgi:acyl carrier protein
MDIDHLRSLDHRLAGCGITIPWVERDARLVEDLELDSFQVVLLFVTIEQEFSVALPDSEVSKVATVADLLALLPAGQGTRSQA